MIWTHQVHFFDIGPAKSRRDKLACREICETLMSNKRAAMQLLQVTSEQDVGTEEEEEEGLFFACCD